MWHLFCWHAWTANIRVSVSTVKAFLACFRLCEVWTDSHILCGPEARSAGQSMDHHAPDLWVPSVPFDLHIIIHWQLPLLPPQLWGLSRDTLTLILTLCVCVTALRRLLSLKCGWGNGFLDHKNTTPTHMSTPRLLHFPSPTTKNTHILPQVRQSPGFGPWPTKRWLTAVTAVIRWDPEITSYHQGGVRGEGSPQGSTPPLLWMENGGCMVTHHGFLQGISHWLLFKPLDQTKWDRCQKFWKITNSAHLINKGRRLLGSCKIVAFNFLSLASRSFDPELWR